MSMRALREWGSAILAAVALLASGASLFVERTADVKDAAIKERLARIEAHQEDMKRQLERIENKLDGR